MIPKLDIGTAIYLTKFSTNKSCNLYIKPGINILADYFKVSYDVRTNGKLVIPKDTIVVGNWISDDNGVQLQIESIYLETTGQKFYADSDVVEHIKIYDDPQQPHVSHLPYLYIDSDDDKTKRIKNTLVYKPHKTYDVHQSQYTKWLVVDLQEIIVYLRQDFIPYPKI